MFDEKYIQNLGWKDLKGQENLENLNVDMRIILKVK
jgi:hypothetical protein